MFTQEQKQLIFAAGVPDRVFFVTNESVLTTASKNVKKTSFVVKKNEDITVVPRTPTNVAQENTI